MSKYALFLLYFEQYGGLCQNMNCSFIYFEQYGDLYHNINSSYIYFEQYGY